MGVSTDQWWAATGHCLGFGEPAASSVETGTGTPSFFGFVLEALLLIGGVESNPGPIDKDYMEDGNAAGNGQDSRGSSGIPGRDDDRKLFVGGLSRQTTDRELKDYFSKFGEIENITVKVDQYTGQSRGFAFIVFSNSKTIEKLLGSDHYINNRKVDPKRVSKKTQQGKIFVGGLTPDITDADIKNYFSQHGTIVEVQSPFDKIKNQRKGFCFITFESKDVVYELLKTPKQYINGKEVDVRKVQTNPESAWGGGGQGGGRSDGRSGWSGSHGGGGYAGYGGGSTQDYDSYDYGDGSYNDYSGGYGYESSGGQSGGYGGGAKPRGDSRQFYRHQPY